MLHAMGTPAPTPPAPPPESADVTARAEADRRALELSALLEILGSSRKLMWVNFLAGLARGVGFFLGVTLVGALLIGILATLFDHAARTLGFRDITLKDAVRAAVVKFEEIRGEVESVQREIATGKRAAPEAEPTQDR
ncbi:MAG: hypothetical protein FJ296_04620 [Planctomycetes bacterium]|nr:hypothetical protein [Planctomycetota bacterium]